MITKYIHVNSAVINIAVSKHPMLQLMYQGFQKPSEAYYLCIQKPSRQFLNLNVSGISGVIPLINSDSNHPITNTQHYTLQNTWNLKRMVWFRWFFLFKQLIFKGGTFRIFIFRGFPGEGMAFLLHLFAETSFSSHSEHFASCGIQGLRSTQELTDETFRLNHKGVRDFEDAELLNSSFSRKITSLVPNRSPNIITGWKKTCSSSVASSENEIPNLRRFPFCIPSSESIFHHDWKDGNLFCLVKEIPFPLPHASLPGIEVPCHVFSLGLRRSWVEQTSSQAI